MFIKHKKKREDKIVSRIWTGIGETFHVNGNLINRVHVKIGINDASLMAKYDDFRHHVS